MNKCIFIGNLTRDPEHQTTGGGVSYCRFTIAVNRSYTNASGEREADFINIVTWRGLADNCAKYLSKGRKVCVVGQLQNRTYDDKEGNKRRSAEVVADNVYFGDSKRDSADGGFNQSQGYAQSFNQIPQQPQPAYQAPQNVSAASSDFSMLSDDDPELPF